MMRNLKVKLLVMLALGLGLLSPVAINATDTQAKGEPQTLCPVMDFKINKDIHADVDGKRVYFCCPHCIEKFKGDSAQYFKKLEDQKVTLEDAR